MIRHALVMSAGRGERMGSLTRIIPKAMAPYGGTTLVADIIARARASVESVHVTVGYKGAMLAAHAIENNVASVINTGERSNSWWLFHTLFRLLDEPLFVLTCDHVASVNFAALEADYRALGFACLLVAARPVVGVRGDYIARRDQVVISLSRERETDIYCSGIQVLNPRRVNEIAEGAQDFDDVWCRLIAVGQLGVSRVLPDLWDSADTVEDLIRVNARLRGGL